MPGLSSQQQAFLQTYGPLAQDVATATGLHPSVVLGQMAQETGWGAHVGNNNPFGISPGGTPASYPSIPAGAQAYVGLIRSRYAKAAAAKTPAEQAQLLQSEGYNPDPTYGTKVGNIAGMIHSAGPAARMTDAQMNAYLLGGGAPSGAAPATGSAPAPAAPAMSDADMDKFLLQGVPAAAAPSGPPVDPLTGVAPIPLGPSVIPASGVTAAPASPAGVRAPQGAPTMPPGGFVATDPASGASYVQSPASAPVGGSGAPIDLSYAGLSRDLAPAPNTTYGSVLPIARNDNTGAYRLALPSSLRSMAQGAVDLAYGPETGTVTPAATGALMGVMGGLTPSPAAGSGAAIAALADREAASRPNPLALAPPPRTISAFGPNALSAERATAGTPEPLAGAASPQRLAAQEAAESAAIPEKVPPAPKVPPLTQGSADQRAEQLVRHFAARKGAPTTAPDVVPGFVPTLAQLTNDPGIATLERGVQSAHPGAIGLRQEANQGAINDFAARLVGTPEDVESAQAAREAATTPLREAALADAAPVDTAPLVDHINEILAGPQGKRAAVRSTLGKVLSALHVGNDADGALETDPAQLYGVRMHINDLLSPAAQRENPELQLAARSLSDVKGHLDDIIEGGAPGFKDYVSKYAELSRPVDTLQYLQGLNLTDQAGNVLGSKLDTALKGITKLRNAPGANKAMSIPDDVLGDLQRLHNTVQMSRFSGSAGKTLGSNTFQNLATNSAVGAVTGNPLVHLGMAGMGGALGGIPGAVLGAGTNMAAQGITHRAESMVTQAIIERLLNHGGKGVAALLPGTGR